MSETLDRVEPVFEEIADLLGQLAGNEAALRFQNAEWDREPPEGYVREQVALRYPGDHGFERVSGVVMMATTHPDFQSGSTTNADITRAMQAGIDEIWEREHTTYKNGATSTLFRIASQNVWEPDVATIDASIVQLSSLARFLDDQLSASSGWVPHDDAPHAPSWLPRLRADWPATSESSQSFYAFWDDVNDKCALYLNMAARLGAATAGVSAIVTAYQRELVDAAEAVRDQARLALQQWQRWQDSSGAWPTGRLQDNSDKLFIMGGVSLVAGVAAFIPPISIPAGLVSTGAGALSMVTPSERVVMESAEAVTSSTLHEAFMNDLRRLDEEMRNALDALRTEPVEDITRVGSSSMGLSAFTDQAVASRRDWSPPEVNL